MPDYDPAETGVMIDAETTADRDDAIWIEPRGDGHEVWVHIARVADHVPAGQAADDEARRRVHTRYRADHTRRMLPREVEERACLHPDRVSETVVVHLRVDSGGHVSAAGLGPGRLKRSWALSHGEAAAAAGDARHPLHEMMARALRFAQSMLSARRASGALAFYDLLSGFATNEEGQLVRLDAAERNSGYVIVQEFMIAANAQIASWAVERDLPILFRNHRMAAVAGDPEELRDELDAVAATGDAEAFEMLRRRTRMVSRPATYAPTVHGHSGLRLPVYTHATSPIRRYPDLVNQRILLAAVEDRAGPYRLEALADLAEEVNTRIADERERTAEHFRRRAKEAAERHLEEAEFHDLPYAQFAKVLRVALERGEAPDGLVKEAERRLDEGELQLRELASVYFEGRAAAFTGLRLKLNHHLCEEPHVAVSLVNKYLQDQLGGPVGPQNMIWEVEPVPGLRVAAFKARLEIHFNDQRRRSAVRTQRTKKDARNQAALSLAADLAELPDLSGDVDPREVDPGPPRTPSLVDPDLNPVEAVQIYLARGVIDDLFWRFDHEGPAHERVHTCAAGARLHTSGVGIDAEGRGTSKQSAKNAAAEVLRVHIEAALRLSRATEAG